MDVLGGLLAAGNVEVAAARRAGADEDRIVALREQPLQAVDALAEARLDAHVDDVADLLVDDRFRQAEFRDLGADHAAAPLVAVIEHDVVAERHQIARDGERGGAGADQGDALAVLLLWRCRQQRLDVALVVGGDALQPADRHGAPFSTRPRRQAGSQGRSQVRPRMPGNTFDFQLTM